jgi:hypothetical protein
MKWEDEEGKVGEMGGLDLWEKRVGGIIGAKEAAAAGAEGGEDGEGGGAEGRGENDEDSTNQQRHHWNGQFKHG